MKALVKIISYLSLILLIGSPFLFFFQKITLEKNKELMLIATILWFSAAFYQEWRAKVEKA